jgi:hypothetical protein
MSEKAASMKYLTDDAMANTGQDISTCLPQTNTSVCKHVISETAVKLLCQDEDKHILPLNVDTNMETTVFETGAMEIPLQYQEQIKTDEPNIIITTSINTKCAQHARVSSFKTRT